MDNIIIATIKSWNIEKAEKIKNDYIDRYNIIVMTNKDEFNTFWEPKFTSILSLELNIFNRWGERIYNSSDNTGRWDGTFNGVSYC